MPPKAIFKGQTFAISGRLSQSQKEYDELIRKHGGIVATSLTKMVTFLITTDTDVKTGSDKVTLAKARGVPLVQEGFIGACITAKKLLEPGFFLIKSAGATKRKAVAKDDLTGAAKKRKTTVLTTSDVVVLAKSGLVGKGAVIREDISKAFVKASLTWDVELVLSDPASAKDKFYCMQLIASNKGDEFWAVQHWGKTGSEGRVHVDGPFSDVDTAKRVFKRKYRSKTGNVWGQVGATFEDIPGKYKLLVKADESKRAGLWQYYMHNVVDGKEIGWYDYDGSVADNMEKYWRLLSTNEGLEVRIVQTDYFKYEIDFGEMIQTNMKSGTRRVIRRISPGETPSSKPPSKIPDKVAPRAVDDADDDDEDEEDDPAMDAEEEDAEDEADDAEEEGKAGEAEEEAVAEEKDDAEATKAVSVARSVSVAAKSEVDVGALSSRSKAAAEHESTDIDADAVTEPGGDDEDWAEAETLAIGSRASLG